MSSFPLFRAQRPALFIVLCLTLVVLVSAGANRQHAGALSRHGAGHYASVPLAVPDKGAIAPEGNTITVNTGLDPGPVATDGLCSLREAIQAANSNVASGAVPGECAAGSNVGADVISLTGLTGIAGLTGALPNLASDITMIGPGAGVLAVAGGGGAYRIFNITSGSNVSISGLTVRDGRTQDANIFPVGTGQGPFDGGGIQNLGTLTMTDVTVTANRTGAGLSDTTPTSGSRGGGIANAGTLVMTNCTVSANTTGAGGIVSSTPAVGGDGGGIYNTGTLTMTNCVVSGNSTGRGGNSSTSSGRGGGIYSSGSLTLTSTSIINNKTQINSTDTGGDGGAIYTAAGQATLTDCSVSNNRTSSDGDTGFGGGIRNIGPMTLVRTLISGNLGRVSGIYNGNVLTITNTTVSGNLKHGAIDSSDPNTILRLTNCTITGNVGTGVSSITTRSARNTIIAGNTGTTDIEGSGTFTSLGHNLIGKTTSGSTVHDPPNPFTAPGDQFGTSAAPLDPRLGPLANNGGTSMTHALLSNSTALDAGDDCVTDVAHCGDSFISQLTTDQRGAGFSRQVDGPDVDTTATVDIGAYETQTPLANLGPTSTNEDTQVLVPFDAGDPATIVSVTATSSNPVLVPNDAAHLSAAINGSTGVVTINPATNLNGTTNITVTVNRTGGPENNTFLLTVNPVNDAPAFVKGADQVVNEDAGGQTVSWATSISPGPADEAGQVLTFQVTGNTNAGLFAVAPAVSSSGTLTYTTAANANGSATITINLQDNGGTANGGVDTSASQTFTITVNAVNDAPSFTTGADQTVNEDAGAQSVVGWATAISRGAADESGQTVTFQVTNNTNAALFSVAPAISSTGTLTYTPVANANGSATITINLKDNGGTANGGVDTSATQNFTITVNAVNDAPSFTKGANQTVNEDASAQTVNNWATAISAGPANEAGQTLTFQVTNNTNAALFSAGPAVSSTGTLTYTPAANANGSATITINLKDDGGTASGGVDTSASQTFTITINSVNDAPSFTKGADQTVNNNAGAQSVPNWATNISVGPANESGQTLAFQISQNTNPALFSAGPAVSSTGTLSYTPAANVAGTATLNVRVQDNGGIANGGVDISPIQTFTITTVAVGGTLNFSAAAYNTTESSGFTTVTVKRTGDLSRAVTVDYTSSGNTGFACSSISGIATPKCDFTTAVGTLNFAAGEDTKVINILISQDGFVEGSEQFDMTLSNPTNNAALGLIKEAGVIIADDATEPAPPTNVIDDARNFVRQHYHDFLNREPDQSGWDFWTNQITSCGSDVQCNEVRRIDVSASFFLSIEFQQTGYLVERFYKVAYADATGNSTFGSPHTLPVPIVRFDEFMKDTQRIGRGVIVLSPGWEQALENNKQAYALEFVQTTRFINALPTTMTPSQFVTRLNQNAGGPLSLSEQQTAINLFGGAGNTTNQTARAQAVRMVADDQDLYSAEFNRAFVLAQYFGYLRRNPNDAPDTDYTGYDFWLTKLNQFNGNYINAEMVKAFLSSIEYRQRFGP